MFTTVSHNLQSFHQPQFVASVKKRMPVVIEHVKKTAISLSVGGLMGYGLYWWTRLEIKLGWNQAGAGIHPLPYILVGVASAAIYETAALAYKVFLRVLGERAVYENLAHPETASFGDRLRRHTWRVVTQVEKIPQGVDTVFSRVFGIRTAKTIRDKKIPIRDLTHVEIFRLAFVKQIFTTLRIVIPQELGRSLVILAGFNVLTGSAIATQMCFCFVFGLISDLDSLYKVRKQEQKAMEEKRPEQEKLNQL